MFEMFITLAAALVAALYGFSRSVFMNGPHRHLYRMVLVVFVIAVYLIFAIYHHVRSQRIHKLHVDYDDYIYYEKYTSILYRAGYFISYLIQNVLFDYIYMRRNFNFCKGLDVYDGGVGEYYIKFRGTWYQYLKLTMLRHRISLKKLQAYAAETKNSMILEAMETEEEKEPYLAFSADVEKIFQEHHLMAEHLMMPLPLFDQISPLYRRNLIQQYHAMVFIQANEPLLIEYVNRQNRRSQKDINDFKKARFK